MQKLACLKIDQKTECPLHEKNAFEKRFPVKGGEKNVQRDGRCSINNSTVHLPLLGLHSISFVPEMRENIHAIHGNYMRSRTLRS